jgi:hypothetical protein
LVLPQLPGDAVTVIHETYLPFRAEELGRHFAEVTAGGDPNRHTRYYLRSAENAGRLARQVSGLTTMEASARRVLETYGYQMQKDERFWVAAALMSLFRAPDPVRTFADLFARALPEGPGEGGSWESLLGTPDELALYFEVNLPAPESYRRWLRSHAEDVVLLPWLRASLAGRPNLRVEGQTKADAMLISRSTGFAAVFEAKVLSDISTHTTYDSRRNQLARNIDVLLDRHPRLAEPLRDRDPEQSFVFLLTPEQFREQPETRLYGSLLNRYRTEPQLLHRHLPHRDTSALAGARQRLGWLTWEDCEAVLPRSCPWLTIRPDDAIEAPLPDQPSD